MAIHIHLKRPSSGRKTRDAKEPSLKTDLLGDGRFDNRSLGEQGLMSFRPQKVGMDIDYYDRQGNKAYGIVQSIQGSKVVLKDAHTNKVVTLEIVPERPSADWLRRKEAATKDSANIVVGKTYTMEIFDALHNTREDTEVKVVDYVKRIGQDAMVEYVVTGGSTNVRGKRHKLAANIFKSRAKDAGYSGTKDAKELSPKSKEIEALWQSLKKMDKEGVIRQVNSRLSKEHLKSEPKDTLMYEVLEQKFRRSDIEKWAEETKR